MTGRGLRRLALAVTLVAAAGATSAAPVRPRPRCHLLVLNKTPYRVLVHIDGVYWGWVNAQRTFTFRGVPGGDVVVYGATQYGEFLWGPKALRCEGQATWELGL